MDLIWNWLKKILETQLSILILTFVIGLIVKYDDILAFGNRWGWLIGLWLQVFVMIALVMNWQKVFKLFSRVTRGIQNPKIAMRDFRYSGNMYDSLSKGLPSAARGAKQIGNKVGSVSTTVAGIAGSYFHANPNAQYSLSNYSKIQPYEPQQRTKVTPKKLNSITLNDYKKSNTPNNASDINKNAEKVIDFSKIPKYQSKNQQSTKTVQRPVSYSIAANGEDLYISKNISVEAAQKPHASSYRTRASSYTNVDKSSSEGAQRPRTVTYTSNSNKSPEQTQTSVISQTKSKGQKLSEVSPKTRLTTQKPVVEKFEFDSKKSTINNAITVKKPIIKHKPVVEQFNFNPHRNSKK